MTQPSRLLARPRPVPTFAMAREDARLTRRRWLLQAAATGAAGVVGTGLYAWRFEPHWPRVTRRTMPLRGLPAPLVGKRLVQISDLHVGPIVDNDYLRDTLRRVASLKPDYLALTGDFMTSEEDEYVDAAVEMLDELPIRKTPTFACLGNHDYGEDFHKAWVADRMDRALRDAGVLLLRNESIEVDGLQVAGCGDLWGRECNVYKSLTHVDTDRAVVYLAHNPDVVDKPGWGGFQGWVLAGHTHGGQCRFPLIGAPVLPIRNHRYSAGKVRLSGGRTLYVNRGLGYKRRVRFGVRPEVTVFTLAIA